MVVKVKAKVVQDDTGVYAQLPVLIDEAHEVVMPLLDYCLMLQREDRSLSTINNVIKSTQLLLEYMAANSDEFNDPKTLFEVFSSRLYTGTVDENGCDPSGLYWLPLSLQSVRLYTGALSLLTDWLAKKYDATPVNPLVEADNYTQKLNYAAWFRKNQNDFLGHIKDKNINQTVRYARNVRGKSAIRQLKEAISFPEDKFENFFLHGIGGAKDRCVAIRDQLILLLMHGGGLRESEALHLWLDDVSLDIPEPESVRVTIFHPEEGTAPNGWKSKSGATNRACYLREMYALEPRIKLAGKKNVGWKSAPYDCIDVYWFPKDYGRIFASLWQTYLRLLTEVGAEFRHHPYAFISFRKEKIGQPYTLNAFNYNYSQGLKRVGLQPGKANGLSPHAHRHSYGRRLMNAEIHPRIIQKALHHCSLESQQPYTTPDYFGITQALDKARDRLHRVNEGDSDADSWAELSNLLTENNHLNHHSIHVY